jgi:hypothetical protein
MAKPRVEYSEEMVEKVCDAIASPKSLTAVCKNAWAPNKKTFLRWVEKYPTVRAAYEQAIRDREERLFEEVIEIADSGRDPAKTRVQVDARKWVLARMNPKKYGDRMTNELTGAGGGPIESNMTITFVKSPKRDDDEPEAVPA